MERSFDDSAMLHFIRDSLFRSDSPLHHEFSVSLERFIAERIASRESEWFPCLSCDLHSCSLKLADTQAKVIELEHRIDGLQATAASATAATDHRVNTLQSSKESSTQAVANELRRVEHELSQCYALLNEFIRASSPHLRTTSSFHNHNHSYIHNHRLLRINHCMHRRAVHVTLHTNYYPSHLSSNHIQHISSQSSMLRRKRFWDAVSSA